MRLQGLTDLADFEKKAGVFENKLHDTMQHQ
jgi:hypothetical protein